MSAEPLHSELTILRVVEYIRQHGAVSRIQVARDLNLSKATVTHIVKQLQTCDLVQDGADVLESSPVGGRRPVPVQINPDSGYVVAIDLASPRITALVIDMGLSPQLRLEFGPSTSNAQDSVTDSLIAIIDGIMTALGSGGALVQGIAVAVRGLNYDDFGGNCDGLIDTQYHEQQVAMLEERYGIPAMIVHNLSAMLVAEMLHWGMDRSANLLLHIGEGIGGAVWIGNDTWQGSHLAAGEWGHVVVQEGGKPCPCGNFGCLETMYSIPGIVEQAHARDDTVASWTDVVSKISNPSIFPIFHEFASVAAKALAGAVTLIDPARIIVQGPILDVDSAFLPAFERELRRRILPRMRDAIVIVPSQTGADATALGAGCRMVGTALARVVRARTGKLDITS